MASTSRQTTCPRDKSQNLYHLLRDRENGIDRRYRTKSRPAHKFSIEFFKCIPPNLTVTNIVKPTNFIRKFSPDGKYLICFSKNQQAFENYEFLGTANASNLIYNWKTECVPQNENEGYASEIRETIFDKLFRMKWSVQMTVFMRPLYREFSLFTDDGKYVIVATCMPIQEESIPAYYTLNTMHGITFEYDLNAYRFYTVRLEDGAIWDSIEYTNDYINLSHNHGVSLYGNRMSVVSIFHQWVTIIQVENGRFITLFTIGRNFHGSDDCLCSTVPEYAEQCDSLSKKFDGLKQKALIRLYKNIWTSPENLQAEMLKHFYKKFKVYNTTVLHKAQMIDNDHVLIRYDAKPPITEPPDQTKMFIVYSISLDEVVSVYREKDAEFLCIMTYFYDDFRQTRSMFTGRAPSSVGNNIHLRRAQRRLISGNRRGFVDISNRLLSHLPMSSQSYTVSPYLDLDLFRYSEHLISALERPRYSSIEPIRFTDRDTDLTKFRIFSTLPEPKPKLPRISSTRELVAFTFHPFEPFAISVQKISGCYVTNIHIRNEGTVVKP